MKKMLSLLCALLLFSLSACGQGEVARGTSNEDSILEEGEASASLDGAEEDETMLQIQVTANGNDIVFALNDSQAAQDLYAQLPLRVEVEDYSTNEKIFYPPQELDVSDAPQAGGAVGTLAYYAPWGDIVMFYDDASPASGLYILGQAVSGSEYIAEMSGLIEIEQLQS